MRRAVVSTAGTRASSPECGQGGGRNSPTSSFARNAASGTSAARRISRKGEPSKNFERRPNRIQPPRRDAPVAAGETPALLCSDVEKVSASVGKYLDAQRSSRPRALGRPRPSAVRAAVEIRRRPRLREIRPPELLPRRTYARENLQRASSAARTGANHRGGTPRWPRARRRARRPHSSYSPHLTRLLVHHRRIGRTVERFLELRQIRHDAVDPVLAW